MPIKRSLDSPSYTDQKFMEGFKEQEFGLRIMHKIIAF